MAEREIAYIRDSNKFGTYNILLPELCAGGKYFHRKYFSFNRFQVILEILANYILKLLACKIMHNTSLCFTSVPRPPETYYISRMYTMRSAAS